MTASKNIYFFLNGMIHHHLTHNLKEGGWGLDKKQLNNRNSKELWKPKVICRLDKAMRISRVCDQR